MNKIGFFPGSFKPLHRGHYQSIVSMCECVDELHVLMSVKNRGELSGLACKQYVEKYVAPTLPNVVFHYIDGSPVGEMYSMIEKLDKDALCDVYLFAGIEDAGSRYRPEALKKNFPNLVGADHIHVEVLAPVSLCRTGCRGVKRISGTDTRRYLAEGNRVKLREALPNVSLVQKNISEIIRLFTS
jgi:cytidyltransferase-like protein